MKNCVAQITAKTGWNVGLHLANTPFRAECIFGEYENSPKNIVRGRENNNKTRQILTDNVLYFGVLSDAVSDIIFTYEMMLRGEQEL